MRPQFVLTSHGRCGVSCRSCAVLTFNGSFTTALHLAARWLKKGPGAVGPLALLCTCALQRLHKVRRTPRCFWTRHLSLCIPKPSTTMTLASIVLLVFLASSALAQPPPVWYVQPRILSSRELTILSPVPPPYMASAVGKGGRAALNARHQADALTPTNVRAYNSIPFCSVLTNAFVQTTRSACQGRRRRQLQQHRYDARFWCPPSVRNESTFISAICHKRSHNRVLFTTRLMPLRSPAYAPAS
jgi:hypothetical protein